MGPSDDFSKDARRGLRMKLKEDLNKVRILLSKVEAREMQLLQSRSVCAHSSFSDSQFSAHCFNVNSGPKKEVTSHSNLLMNCSLQYGSLISKQESARGWNGSLAGVEPMGSKCIARMSQVYKESGFLVGKGKVLSPGKKLLTNFCKSNFQANGITSEEKLHGLSTNSKMWCKSILKKLMDHEHGWIFNEPVDVIKLGLSDYHSVIKKPMDLGTIKSRLDKREYKSLLEFADDVELTFNNAMSYNPPGNDVHQSAKVLVTMFQRYWDALKEAMSRTNRHGKFHVRGDLFWEALEGTQARSEANRVDNQTGVPFRNPLQLQSGAASVRHIVAGKAKILGSKSISSHKSDIEKNSQNTLISQASIKPRTVSKSPLTKAKTCSKLKTSTSFGASAKTKATARPVKPKNRENRTLTQSKSSMQKKVMNYEEKVRLQALLVKLPQQNLEELIYLTRERINFISQEDDEIEVDLDSFNDETLWELHDRAIDCLQNLKKSSLARKQLRKEKSATGRSIKRPKVASDQNVIG